MRYKLDAQFQNVTFILFHFSDSKRLFFTMCLSIWIFFSFLSFLLLGSMHAKSFVILFHEAFRFIRTVLCIQFWG